MKPLKPEVVLPAVAVMSWKGREFTAMEAAIVRHALAHGYVCPGDIPEDVVAEQSRQGVASNAWNVLASLELVEMVPAGLFDEARGICGGRKRNKNPKAKGRWTAVYQLKSRALAEAWLRRHGLAAEAPKAEASVQEELL